MWPGAPYLPELLYHVFNEDVSVLGNFAFHLRQPFAKLLVLFTEDCPFVQSLADLLPPQGELKSRTREKMRKNNQSVSHALWEILGELWWVDWCEP